MLEIKRSSVLYSVPEQRIRSVSLSIKERKGKKKSWQIWEISLPSAVQKSNQ